MRKNRKIWFFSPRTFLEVVATVSVNLTSGWWGVLLVAPGFFGTGGVDAYWRLLINTLPFAIVSLIVTLWLYEKLRK